MQFKGKLLASVFPKSGTHLMLQMLNAVVPRGQEHHLSSFAMFGWGEYRWPSERQMVQLEGIPDDTYIMGHLAADREYIEYARNNGWKVVFVYRDLRDIVVSTAYHIESPIITRNFPNKHQWEAQFPTHEERMAGVITGWKDLPPLRWRWEQYWKWWDHRHDPWLMAIPFEYLREHQSDACEAIAGFLGLPTREAGERMELFINPYVSTTFRKGNVGDWTFEFTPALVDLAKQELGDWIIKLGYEENDDWGVTDDNEIESA